MIQINPDLLTRLRFGPVDETTKRLLRACFPDGRIPEVRNSEIPPHIPFAARSERLAYALKSAISDNHTVYLLPVVVTERRDNGQIRSIVRYQERAREPEKGGYLAVYPDGDIEVIS